MMMVYLQVTWSQISSTWSQPVFMAQASKQASNFFGKVTQVSLTTLASIEWSQDLQLAT